MNGPSNIIRLQLNDITIYVLFDKDKPIDEQFYCKNIENIDINKFIVKTQHDIYLKYPDKMFTFYVASYLSSYRNAHDFLSNDTIKGTYMDGLLKLCKNNGIKNTKFIYVTQNVDIYSACRNIASQIRQIYLFIWTNRKYSHQNLTVYKDALTLFQLELQPIYDWFNDNNNNSNERILEEVNEYIESIANKLEVEIGNFNNIIIQNKSTLQKNTGPDIDVTLYYTFNYEHMIKIYDMLLKLNYFLESIEETLTGYINSVHIIGQIMKGVNNSVLYLSETYGVNILYFLIKYYRFRITNAFYLMDVEDNKENILKNTELYVRQAKSFKEITKVFIQQYSPNCINLDNFNKVELFL